jgi:hypothetical protein
MYFAQLVVPLVFSVFAGTVSGIAIAPPHSGEPEAGRLQRQMAKSSRRCCPWGIAERSADHQQRRAVR